jgi:hypothetical protein
MQEHSMAESKPGLANRIWKETRLSTEKVVGAGLAAGALYFGIGDDKAAQAASNPAMDAEKAQPLVQPFTPAATESRIGPLAEDAMPEPASCLPLPLMASTGERMDIPPRREDELWAQTVKNRSGNGKGFAK